MSAEHHPLAAAEAWLGEHRPMLVTKLEEAMSHLSDLIANGRTLAAERVALIADRDAERARAEAAESHAADLQARIDADDAAAADAKAELDAEIAKEAGVSADGAKADVSGDTSKSGEWAKNFVDGTLANAVQGQAPATPVTTTAPSGATVTVDPSAGTTTHVDPVASITTTLDHATGAATAVDTSVAPAQPVEPAPAVVAEAVQAAAAAGVAVPVQG